MNREEIRELAALYALGGLDGDDLARFEALLRSRDRDATSALGDFEAALLGLARESTQSPPAALRAALLERIGAQGRGEPTRIAPKRPRGRRAIWPAVWAGAMAAGIAAVAV